MGPAREENDDGEKKKKEKSCTLVYLFLSLSETEKDSPRNLPKVKPIVMYFHIILKTKPAKYLLFNSVHL